MLNQNLNILQHKLLQSLFDALSAYRQAGHKLIQVLFLQFPICSDTCLYLRKLSHISCHNKVILLAEQ